MEESTHRRSAAGSDPDHLLNFLSRVKSKPTKQPIIGLLDRLPKWRQVNNLKITRKNWSSNEPKGEKPK